MESDGMINMTNSMTNSTLAAQAEAAAIELWRQVALVQEQHAAASQALEALDAADAARAHRAASLQAQIPTLRDGLATARATLALTTGTDGEQVTRARVAALESELHAAQDELAQMEADDPAVSARAAADRTALQATIDAAEPAIQALHDQHAAMQRAHAEAHAAHGLEVYQALMEAVAESEAAVTEAHAQYDAAMRALEALRDDLPTHLAQWPDLAAQCAVTRPPVMTPTRELVRRWVHLAQWLLEHGAEIPRYDPSASAHVVTALELPMERLSQLLFGGEYRPNDGGWLAKRVRAARETLGV